MDYHIVPLSGEYDRSSFDCGEPTLNEFLRLYASQNDRKGLGRTFIAVKSEDRTIYGYYTVSTGSVLFNLVPENLPRYPVPVAHIGRLAVSQAAQGQGLGETLLMDAFKKIALASEHVGVYAIEVHCLNERARSFYLRYGFTELLDDRLHLYIPMKLVRKLPHI